MPPKNSPSPSSGAEPVAVEQQVWLRETSGWSIQHLLPVMGVSRDDVLRA